MIEKITLKTKGGKKLEVSLDEARELYNELSQLFDRPISVDPIYPYTPYQPLTGTGPPPPQAWVATCGEIQTYNNISYSN